MMNAADARRIVVQNIIFNLTCDLEWSDYDEIGEDDWDSIVAMLDVIAPEPSNEEYVEAYAVLKGRAEL